MTRFLLVTASLLPYAGLGALLIIRRFKREDQP